MARTSKRSAEYWADRLSRQNQRMGDKTVEEIETRLRQYYRAASADITREAEGLYNKLLAEAGDQPVRMNDLYRLDRLYHLQTKIHKRLQELGGREIETMDDRLRKLAELVDQNTVSGLPDAAKNSPWAVLPREEAEAIANRIWCADGQNWSDRIWKNKTALQQRLEKGLVDSVVRGAKSDDLTKTLMRDFGVGYREASRIARTETTHVRAEAEAAALEREGYDRYRFVNATDGRTCDECGRLNGKTFRLSERRAGVNFPPIHPNCRGRAVAVVTFEGGTEVQPVIQGAGHWKMEQNRPQEATVQVEIPMESSILSEEERAAVTSYISSDSYLLNAKLREGIPLEPQEEAMAEALDRALEKMPVFIGTVYRSLSDFQINDMDRFMETYTPGAEVSFPSYLSTSDQVYDPSFPVQYVIISRSGRDIRSFNPEESEILYKRNSRFRVIKVEGQTIYLEECP